MNTDDPIEPAQYDVLRAALRDEAAPAPARESAVAAALAVFDDLQSAAAPAVAPAPVIPLRRRNWWTVGLSAAAAAAVVLFIALGMIRPNASNVALSDAMMEGEMAKFRRLLAAQKDVEGLQEITVTADAAEALHQGAVAAPTRRVGCERLEVAG